MHSEIYEMNPKVAIAPVVASGNTPLVGNIIDSQGHNALSYIIATGTLTDADATFAVTVEHGNDSGLSDTASVPADQLAGTLANAGFTFAADNATRKLGYIGYRRYTRITVTPTSNSTASAAPIAVVAVLGDALSQPTPAVPT